MSMPSYFAMISPPCCTPMGVTTIPPVSANVTDPVRQPSHSFWLELGSGVPAILDDNDRLGVRLDALTVHRPLHAGPADELLLPLDTFQSEPERVAHLVQEVATDLFVALPG